MIKRIGVSLVAILAFGATGLAVADTDATPHQIYEAAQSGHLAEAQQMIGQVLRDHPQNAKAHFIAAELDVRIGDQPAARQQLASAKQLDPTLAFASPQALSSLERQLTGMRQGVPERGVGSQSFAPVAHRPSLPWGLIIVVALGAFVLWSIFRNRAQRTYGPGYPPGALPPGNPGMQPGMGYGPGYPPPAGGGSGLMGNLASGLAVGAGVAAGEELIRHVMDGNGNVVPAPADFRDQPQNQDMGGNDFGTSGDDSSWGSDSGGGDSGGGWGGDSGGGGGGGDWT